MPTFQKCDASVYKLANDIILKFDTHKPLGASGCKIDLVFAFCDRDEKSGRPLNDALTKNGIRALGITRSIPLKDRALGRGDAEVALDGDWWKEVGAEEQEAMLDHELHHISIKCDKNGNIHYDDLNRPLIKIRKHDVEVGWFRVIAERHGSASIEQQQAKKIMDSQGQFYWPGIAPTVQLEYQGKMTGPMPMDTFAKAAAKLAGRAEA